MQLRLSKWKILCVWFVCVAEHIILDRREDFFCRINVSVNNRDCICRYDSGDQLCKEPSCSELGDGRIVTVKEEREVPRSTEADDTLVRLCFLHVLYLKIICLGFIITFSFGF